MKVNDGSKQEVLLVEIAKGFFSGQAWFSASMFVIRVAIVFEKNPSK